MESWRVFKIFFACYAVAFVTAMLIGVLTLPIVGYTEFKIMTGPNSGLYLSVMGLLWSPLIYNYLR